MNSDVTAAHVTVVGVGLFATSDVIPSVGLYAGVRDARDRRDTLFFAQLTGRRTPFFGPRAIPRVDVAGT